MTLSTKPAIDALPFTCPSQQAEALVLNCMDHRLIGAVADYLDGRGLTGKYDQIVLAGGAVGVMADETAPWAETFWAHVGLARELHGISRIIVIDHRDCGACKAFVGSDCAEDPDHEIAVHTQRMEALADEIRTREPGLKVELLFMDLDGRVETLDQ
ncbi:carbonic anhydrase [Cribrihabitans marinus]|nr:carbonic anhydrase [Cribrihabitans marinus]